MNPGRAFVAAVLAGAVMTAVAWLLRLAGLELHFALWLGTVFVRPPGVGAWVVGFLIHLVASGVIGLVYGWAFERLSTRGGWKVGLGFGLAHSLVSGLIVALMPALHPLMPEELPPPGPYLVNFGAWTVVAFFALHMLYGALVGALYGPTKPTPAEAKPVAMA